MLMQTIDLNHEAESIQRPRSQARNFSVSVFVSRLPLYRDNVFVFWTSILCRKHVNLVSCNESPAVFVECALRDKALFLLFSSSSHARREEMPCNIFIRWLNHAEQRNSKKLFYLGNMARLRQAGKINKIQDEIYSHHPLRRVDR